VKGIFVLAALAASVAGATPVVSDVRVSQSSDRVVTVRYALAGAPAIVTMNVQTNAGDGTWADIGGGNVWSQSASGVWSPSGDVFGRVEGDGAHAFTWRPDRSWPDRKLAAGEARIVVTAWAPEDAPDYLSVELKDGGAAGWYPSADYVPGGVLSNAAYRTTSLLMRRIHARGIPATMGSALEIDRRADREDIHTATLTNDYYIGVFEVTQRQWREAGGTTPSALTDVHDLRPVAYVSYEDVRDKGDAAHAWPAPPHADSWLGRLRARTGVDFDLPGEAQWEFACRAGTPEGHWNTGARYGTGYCGRHNLNCGSEKSAVCGTYAPSRWGTYDMHGNVLEWCLDWGRFDIASLEGAVNAEQDPRIGAMRVIRGGGWSMHSSYMRSAFRAWNRPTTRDQAYGFRVACRAGLK